MVSSLLPSIQSCNLYWNIILTKTIWPVLLFLLPQPASQRLILLIQTTPGCSWGRCSSTKSITDNLMWQYCEGSPVKNKLQYYQISFQISNTKMLCGTSQWVQIPMDRFKYKPGLPQVTKLNSKWINFDPISVWYLDVLSRVCKYLNISNNLDQL